MDGWASARPRDDAEHTLADATALLAVVMTAQAVLIENDQTSAKAQGSFVCDFLLVVGAVRGGWAGSAHQVGPQKTQHHVLSLVTEVRQARHQQDH